eukprot:Rhum_TRINITY_DN18908_c0_g1::Rhum_TRINITY_DN18908_c0_g1_i1::g.168756::m.168756
MDLDGLVAVIDRMKAEEGQIEAQLASAASEARDVRADVLRLKAQLRSDETAQRRAEAERARMLLELQEGGQRRVALEASAAAANARCLVVLEALGRCDEAAARVERLRAQRGRADAAVKDQARIERAARGILGGTPPSWYAGGQA